jgi:hypothetical protein
VPADRGVVERIVLIEINVVAVVAINVVALKKPKVSNAEAKAVSSE